MGQNTHSTVIWSRGIFDTKIQTRCNPDMIRSCSARGAKELKDLLGQVRAALDGKEFSYADRTSLICYVLDETVQRDPDGKTRRGVVRVNVIHMGAKEG